MISSVTELMEEYTTRAQTAGLRVDCPGDGAFRSDIAIVSEAPGENEVKARSPFVGGAGGLLWKALAPYGITRRDVYVTNVAKRQVSFGSDDARAPLGRGELDHWFGLLRWELQQLPNLKFVLVLGNYALEALAGQKGITQWRGSVLPASLGISVQNGSVVEMGQKAVTLICTFNPAMVLREPKTEIPFLRDCKRLHLVRLNAWRPHTVSPIINPTLREAVEYIAHLTHGGKPISFDIETMSNETACVGLTNDKHTGMCIGFRTLSGPRYEREEELALRLVLQWLLGRSTESMRESIVSVVRRSMPVGGYKLSQSFTKPASVKLVAQNGSFDASWLWYKDRIRVQPIWFDTMLAHHTLYPPLPHNLGFLTAEYTTHPFYKDDGKTWREGGDIDQWWRYNVTDVCMTLTAQEAMHGELRAQHMERFFFEHVMRLQPHLVRMCVGGIKIDTELKATLNETLGDVVAQARADFDAAVSAAVSPDYRCNPSSAPQLSDLLFNRLKLVGRGPSTDEDNRKRMYAHPRTTDAARKVLDAIDKFKEESKFYSTYVKAQIDPDDRMRSEYKQTGVQNAPGRLSSASVLWGSGTNLQNQPERAQAMYVADSGYSFGYFDLAQAEARVVAWEAPIPKWIEQFERARIDGYYDCHRALASEMFGVPYDEVPTRDRDDHGIVTIRYTAKRCRHGLNYRMGPDRLATTTGLPLLAAQQAYEKYHFITPELKRWWRALEEEVRKHRMLFNAFGRRWFLLERMSPDALEAIVAFKPQSTVGDKVCRVIYKSEDDPRWPRDARVVLNTHDGLICTAPHDKVKRCLQIMKRHAEEPILIKGHPLIIPAEFKISVPDEHGVHRWSRLEKVEIET